MSLHWKARIDAAMILLIMEFFSIIALKLTPRDDTYYLVCGAFNLAIVCILGKSQRNVLIADLQRLNFLALLIQFFGFLSYWYDVNIQIYNNAIHLLNFMQAIRLLFNGKDDANECSEGDPWLPLVRDYYLRCLAVVTPKETKL